MGHRTIKSHLVSLLSTSLLILITLPYTLAQPPIAPSALPDTLSASAATLLEAAREYLHQKPELALQYAAASRRNAETDGATSLFIEAKKLEADALQYTGQNLKAEQLYQELLAIHTRSRDEPSKGDVLKELGNVNAYMGRYERSLQLYQEALAIYKSLNDETGIAKLSNNIGLLYYRLSDYTKANDYYQSTLQLSQRINNPAIEAATYTNLGFLLSRQGNHEQALAYQQQAFERYAALEDHMRWANAYINVGLEYDFLDSLSKAVSCFQMAHSKARQSGHQVIVVDALNKLGAVYIKNQEYTLADQVLHEAYELAQQLNDPSLLNELNQKLSDYYLAVEQLPEALHFYKLWSNLKDSIINQDNLKRISELEVQHQTARQKQEIKILEAQNARQRLFISFTLVTVVLLGFSGLLLWSRYQMRGNLLKKERQLLAQENERRALETENEKQRFEKLKVEQQLKEEENKRLQNELQLKNSELSTVAMLMYQKNEQLASLQKAIDQINPPEADTQDALKQLKQEIRNSIRLDEDWAYFKQHFEQVHPDFFSQLDLQFPHLTQYDHRHCAYIKMNLSTKEISRLLNINPSSVQRSRVRLKKKLSLEKEDDLLGFIRHF